MGEGQRRMVLVAPSQYEQRSESGLRESSDVPRAANVCEAEQLRLRVVVRRRRRWRAARAACPMVRWNSDRRSC